MSSYRDMFILIITLLTGFIGVPIIQWIKVTFGLKEKAAVAISVVIVVGLAIAELLLTGAIGIGDLTVEHIPALFATIYTVAQIYYQIFKKSPGVLGQKGMVWQPQKKGEDLIA